MLPNEVRERMREMRRNGQTFNEICAATGYGKGTVAYVIKDVKLPAIALLRLSERKSARGLKLNQRFTVEERRQIGRKGGRACQRKYGARIVRNLLSGTEASGLAYRKDELPFLTKLNALFCTSFCKERLENVYFDFTDTAHVIEVTTDPKQGIRDAIKRFTVLHDHRDTRRRIAYIRFKSASSRRRQELISLGVEVRNVSEISP